MLTAFEALFVGLLQGRLHGKSVAHTVAPLYPCIRLCHMQIIGMSATMANPDVAARWLDALLYETTFRPVQLKEYIKVRV